MNKTATNVSFALLIAFSFDDAISQTCAPGAARTWISIRDNGTGSDTIWFGYDVLGSYGLDPELCEAEQVPCPQGVFDARWVNIPGREGMDTPSGMGQGFKQDYRHYCGSGIDTFKLKFQAGDGGFPMMFDWAATFGGILSIADSAWLQDEFGGVIFRVRMHAVGSHVVASPAFSSALIIVFHGWICTGVGEKNDSPESFGLFQNYPNPFNPSTEIRFELPSKEFVTLKVMDPLGREVATLVREERSAGSHAISFDAGEYNLASGVYYYRLVAGEYSATKKLMVLK